MPPVLFRFLLCLLLLLSSFAGRAQHRYWDADTDSIRTVLGTQRADTSRLRTIRHLIDLARLGEAQDRQTTLVLLDELLVLDQWKKPEEEAAYQTLRAGVALWMQGGRDEKALATLQQAVELFDRTERPIPRLLIELAPLFNRLDQAEERYAYYRDKLAHYRLHDAKENIAACYLSLGGYYRRKGAYNQAISLYLRAAELFQTFDQRYYISELLVAGANYAEWGNTEKGLEYLQQALQLSGHYARRSGGVDSYALRNISKIYLRQNNLPEALRYADLALGMNTGTPLSKLEDRAYGMVHKSMVLTQMHRMKEARRVLDQVQHLADSLGMNVTGRRQSEFELTAAWAQYYTAQKNYAAAERFWLAAYREAAANKMNVLRRNYLRQLSDFYDQRDNTAEARKYSRAYMTLSDSMTAQQGAYYVAQYEGERVEQAQSTQIANLRQAQAVQALRLRQRSQLLLGALVAIVLVSGFGAFAYRQLQMNKRTLRQLRQTQKQLIAAEKWAFVGEVSAGIAHELQNPLSFMKQFAEVSTAMIEHMATPGQAPGPGGLEQEILTGLKQNLQEISQHGLRASSIIKDMLGHVQSGTGQPKLTNLNQLVEEYLRLAYQSVQGADKAFQAVVTSELDPALPPLEVVPQDLGRALLNVFTNALHAVRQRQQQGEPSYQATVHVRTQQVANTVEIQIIDNGTGMPKSVREKIFEPFFTTKSVGEGTGLGLALSLDVLKAHNGTIQVKTQEGQGTEVVLTLPV
ncbi:ATP-binding protein [Hymenobacter sp. B1770]|uniref:ATP-binding protein n=1 Tax=Hymenobacter sp. B1770 TaxID=1718788 RepID=UPI003CF86246